MKTPIFLFSITFLFSPLNACNSKQAISTPWQTVQATYSQDQFAAYWYSGKAEVASYELKQSRYGEVRNGSAVLIFVTEPFSGAKQVKLDNPDSDDKITVMKMNHTRNFITGIYPYSMMLSAFTPVQADKYPHTLKVTMTSQEWCGQSFTQFNLKRNKYEVKNFSYFESEGDTRQELSAVVLEDELFNRIRVNPLALPLGSIDIVPSSFHNRLTHIPFQVYKAKAALVQGTDSTQTYSIKYDNESRSLSVRFKDSFPYTILNWSETNQRPNGTSETTTATLLKTLHTPYWQQNASEFEYLRDSLLLTN